MDLIQLYRVTSEIEFNGLISRGSFRYTPGSSEGKWFAETIEDARRWGRMLYPADQFRLVEVWLARETADRLSRFERLDNIGPAWFAEMEDLASAIIGQVMNGQ